MALVFFSISCWSGQCRCITDAGWLVLAHAVLSNVKAARLEARVLTDNWSLRSLSEASVTHHGQHGLQLQGYCVWRVNCEPSAQGDPSQVPITCTLDKAQPTCRTVGWNLKELDRSPVWGKRVCMCVCLFDINRHESEITSTVPSSMWCCVNQYADTVERQWQQLRLLYLKLGTHYRLPYSFYPFFSPSESPCDFLLWIWFLWEAHMKGITVFVLLVVGLFQILQ